MEKEIVNAALIIIGDEILSGRTEDKNINYIAKNLSSMGINLCEVRIIPDLKEEISQNIINLSDKYDYVFTSGGIGPTHDDITSESVANAFNVDLELNKEAERILHDHYGVEINEARLKMAKIPMGAKLLDNPISSAPGFRIKNVFVMAGIPEIFQAMFNAAKKELVGGKETKSKEITINLTESVIAKDLELLQKKYPQVVMGSYPFKGGTSLVFRSKNYKDLESSYQEMKDILEIIKDNR